MKIGFIGQGFVGKNIADDYEKRGYEVVRYSLEEEYIKNKESIKDCDLTYIAVPTPTTPAGFDYSIVADAINLVSEGSMVIIKSTLLPGTTQELQKQFPNILVMFSPEFLCEKTAAYDVANPILNIIGITSADTDTQKKAENVMATFPESEHSYVVNANSAELFKYAHNLNGYFRVILSNLLFEVGEKLSVDWAELKPMMDNDVMMSPYYNSPVHQGGRGAGGNCFVKDMAAFRHLYENLVASDESGLSVLRSLEKKNLELLNSTGKSQDIVQGVYGKNLID